MTPHLLPGEIIEAATRQLHDYAAIGHLSECEHCRNKVIEYRATRMALVPAGATQASPPGEDCPPTEELARYSAGHRDPELAGHIAKCDRCAWIVRDALEAGTVSAPGRKQKRRMFLLAGLVTSLLLAGIAAYALLRPRDPAGASISQAETAAASSNMDITEKLARAYSAVRPFEFRLNDAGYNDIRPAAAATDRNGYVVGATTAISRRLATNPGDLEAIAFKGRTELLLGDYQTAIALLTRAGNVWPDDPTPSRDLACALALRGMKEDRPADFDEAIRLFGKVLEQRSTDQVAVFDLALVYEKIFHAPEAIGQWRRFIAAKPGEGWLEEANRHLAALEKIVR